ncbi:MAG TPA: flavodoxin domain-containing protein [Solirubrobacteraceae bacterium]|nr:flavodoxin domain-containing protein [Solirubrobacteraceae bacterium]
MKNAIVVYESVYGNTRALAEAIAAGLDASVLPVQKAGDAAAEAELVVVGGPTHMHGLSTARSRQMAVAGAHEDGGMTVEPLADQEPGLRRWLSELPRCDGHRAAAFDTRLDRAPWMTGMAARGVARRLRQHGFEMLGTESFLVEDAEGPLEQGELERAHAWGEQLTRLLADTAAPAVAPGS